MANSKGKLNSPENAVGQGLASASSVEKLTRRIPDLRDQLGKIEKLSKDTVDILEKILQNLDTYHEDFSNGKNEMLEALDKEKYWINNEQFESDENREEYTATVTNAIKQINCLPDSYDSARSVANELEHSQETLATTTRTRKLLAKMEELLPRHESHELGMWYEEARKRTKLRGLYIGFFSILLVFISLIVITLILGLGQGETENYTTWYTAIAQYTTLRFALLGAFTAALWFLGKQISNQKKIYEEYGHKETMMKSFRGFASKLSSMREVISRSPELANDAAKETISNILKTESELATAAIKIVEKNPAEHLSAEPSRRKTGSES